MYPVLYETGFANQPTATACGDGLELRDLYINGSRALRRPTTSRCPPNLPTARPFSIARSRAYAD